jgi:hypothetical protein
MKLGRVVLALLAVVSTQIAAQEDYNAGMCPTTPKLGDNPSKTYWLDGSIGERPVRMYLEQGGGVVVGAFYYTESDWTPTILGGHLTASGALDASDKTKMNVETGHLTGRLTDDEFVGQWIAHDQSTRLPAFLKAGAQPRCDGAGAWKRFDDNQWPVTFSYPASWRLETSNDGVKVTCPNPSFMAYESYDIEFRQGKQSELADLGFHLIETKWMHGEDCDKTPSACSLVPVRRREGMTILSADEHEWRVYCHGNGYVAQGEGHETVLLIGDRWINLRGEGPPSELIGRIVATARPKVRRQPS